MKKKIFALIITIFVLAITCTGCIRNGIDVKINKNGTGAVSTTIGIEKDAYKQAKMLGSDPFEGKITTEYRHGEMVYVAYTEVKEYTSYDEMEQALLKQTYDADFSNKITSSTETGDNLKETFNVNTVPISDDTEKDAQDSKSPIFSSVNIEKNDGIFYSSYTFNAITCPQDSGLFDIDLSKVKMIITVEMPEEISQFKGGMVEGNKITFDISDFSVSQELAATCESNNTGVVIGIVIGLVVIVAGIFCFIKFKK